MGDIYNFDEEVEPLRGTLSISIPIRSSSRNFSEKQSASGVVTFVEGEQAVIKREPGENSEPLRSTQDDAEVITLSSDEEVEAERIMVLPDLKMEGEPEMEEVHFDDFLEAGGGLESQRKSRRKKLPPKRFSVVNPRHQGNPRRRNKSAGPVISGEEYSIQQQIEPSSSNSNLQNICHYCGRKMATRRSLVRHIQSQHLGSKGPLKYTCGVCEKEMSSEHSLKIHQSSHTDERPFACNLCKTKYKSQFYLDNHMKTKGHLNVEALQTYLGEPLSVETNSQGEWSSTQPRLNSEVASLPKKKIVAAISATSQSMASKGTSTFFRGGSQATGKKPAAIGTPISTSSKNPSASDQQSQPQPGMDLASCGVVSPSMMPPMQGMANPVIFCGYMLNGGSNGSGFPSAILPTQTFMSPAMSSFLPGMYPQQAMQQGHFQQSTSGLRFTCSVCQAQFSVEACLRSHMRDEHSDQCWKCPKCSQVMLNPAEFTEHYGKCDK